MSEDAVGSATQGEPVLPGQLFAGPEEEPDRWQLLGGGMTGGEGTTWQARYVGRLAAPLPRAVKMLHRPPGAGADWPDEADRRRWDDQLAVLRHLDPKRVVRLYSVTTGPPPHLRGEHAATSADAPARPVVYLEMEWLEGPTLDALVRGHPATRATLADRLRLIEQAAEAVADLHSRTRTGGNPALHRDLKPGNCIVEAERGLVLIDLSTLRLSDDGVDPLGRHTPGYAAPEALADPARARGPRSDVYSLGALAVFCLIGQDPPPPSPRGTARLDRQVRAAARAAGVRRATAFARRLTAAVAGDPEQRPADVREWARTLTTLAGPPEARRWRLGPVARRVPRATMLAGAVTAAVVLATGAVLIRPDASVTPGTTDTGTGAATAPGVGPTTAPAPSTPTATPSGATTTAATPGTSGPTDPSAPVPSASGTVPAHPSATGPLPRPTAAVRATGTIAAPTDGARVPQCSYFSGAATLPPGKTLILAMQNISNGDSSQYVEFVFGWQTPAPHGPWRGAQFFGSDDDSVGQRYRVRLMAVDLAEAHRLNNSPALVPDGIPLDSVEVSRVAGAGPNDCVGR
jgi:hypothetical protein